MHTYAAGLRGPLGVALGGITVGGGSFSSASVIEKRIIPIPPHGTEPIYVSNTVMPTYAKNVTPPRGFYKSHSRYLGEKMKKGMVKEFSEENSILKYKATVRYSFTEDCTSPTEVSSSHFVLCDDEEGVSK